jgi:hypothetical protein
LKYGDKMAEKGQREIDKGNDVTSIFLIRISPVPIISRTSLSSKDTDLIHENEWTRSGKEKKKNTEKSGER